MDADVELDGGAGPDVGARDVGVDAAADAGMDADSGTDLGTDAGTERDAGLMDMGPTCIPSPELCETLVDEDCDGAVDEVVETVTCGAGICVNEARSCDVTLPAQCVPLPPSIELCGDGVDQDCDSRVDEVVGDESCGVGACATQAETCDDNVPPMCIPLPPQEEVCNGIDDDCDGTIDLIDRGDDGVPDCLNVLFFGEIGSQPSSSFERWIMTNGAGSGRVLRTANTRLTGDMLGGADVIILDQLARSYSAGEAAILADWVRAGGGLMALTGHYNTAPAVERVNSLVAGLGLEFVFELPVINSEVRVVTDHPAVEGVTRVPVIGGFRVRATGADAQIVGTDVNGRPLIGVTEVGLGRVYLFSDEWVTFDSQWNMLESELRRFWSSALRWLGQSRPL